MHVAFSQNSRSSLISPECCLGDEKPLSLLTSLAQFHPQQLIALAAQNKSFEKSLDEKSLELSVDHK